MNLSRMSSGWGKISRQARRTGRPASRTVRAALPILVAAALLIAACQPEVDQPGAQASASPVEPSPSPPDTWGPLAVTAPQDGADTLRAEGTIRITDTCVYLEWPAGELALLTWPADRTTWSEDLRAITFENFDGSVVTVGDGDHVVLGGGGGDAASMAEGGISGEEWVRRMEWVAPPASSCSLDSWWVVGAVGD